jgi:hypothetical protein
MNNEMMADIVEALENMKKWAPVYKSLLKVCKTKQEAKDALKFLMSIEVDGDDKITDRRAS